MKPYKRAVPNPFLRYPIPSLGVLLAIVAAALLFGRIEVDSEMRALLEGDQRNLDSYEKVNRILGDDIAVIVSIDCPEVFSPDNIAVLRQVTAELKQLKGYTGISAVTDAFRPFRAGFGIRWDPLIPTEGNVDYAKLKEWAIAHPLVRNIMIAPDGRHTIVMANFNRPFETTLQIRKFRSEVDAALAPLNAAKLPFHLLAFPFIEQEILDTLRVDMKQFIPLALLLAVSVLAVTFRYSKRLIIWVLANQVAGLLLLPGLLQVTGLSVSVFTVILLPLLAAVHLALLSHAGTAFQRALKTGVAGTEGIGQMLRESFKPCVYSAVTTAVGLASFASSDMAQLRDFGLLGALGVLMLLVLTFGPGISLLQLMFKSHDGSKLQSSETATNIGWSVRWTDILVRNTRWIWMGMLGCVLLASVGVGRIRTDIRAVEFLSPKSPSRLAFEEMDRVYGGINVVQIQIDSGKSNGVISPEFLKYMARIERHASEKTGVTGVFSYGQLLAALNEMWEGYRPGTLQLPENPILIATLTYLVRASEESLPFIRTLCDESFRVAHLTVRTRDMPADQYLNFVRELEQFANQDKPPQVTVSAQEGIHSILEADRRILRSLQRSSMVTFGVVGVVLLLLWRSPLLVLLALAANAVPIGLVVALQGFAGVPLNSITIMVGSIAFGVVMDDTIHFITHWREERLAGKTAIAAARAALEAKGRAMVCTSLVLIAIVGVFLLSSFPPVVHFGLLSVMGYTAALGAALILLPAVLGSWIEPRTRSDSH